MKKFPGRKSVEKGQTGNVLGRAELIPEAEREASKEGPLSAFLPVKVQKGESCTRLHRRRSRPSRVRRGADQGRQQHRQRRAVRGE